MEFEGGRQQFGRISEAEVVGIADLEYHFLALVADKFDLIGAIAEDLERGIRGIL
jgi:hypothetical protein